MVVNICGIPHKVIETEDSFDGDANLGVITYVDTEIKINKKLKGVHKTEVICHEMVHGILMHLGFDKLCNDEQFVQSLANAIMQGFEIKDIEKSLVEEIRGLIAEENKSERG